MIAVAWAGRRAPLDADRVIGSHAAMQHEPRRDLHTVLALRRSGMGTGTLTALAVRPALSV